MRTAPVLVALLVARVAAAQPTEPAPAPSTEPAPAPSPTPGPAPAPEPAPPQPVADPAYGDAPDPNARTEGEGGPKYVVRYTPDRSHKNIVMLASVGGTALLFGAIGGYFHLASKSAADDVSAKTFTGKPWTDDRQDTYDRSNRDATIAGVMYGIGGALVLTTAILYIVTEPELQETIVRPQVTPTRGGAMLGGGWTF